MCSIFSLFFKLPLHAIYLIPWDCYLYFMFSRVPNIFCLIIFCQFNVANISHSYISLLSLSMATFPEWNSSILMTQIQTTFLSWVYILKFCFRSPSLSLGHKGTILHYLLLTLKVIDSCLVVN